MIKTNYIKFIILFQSTICYLFAGQVLGKIMPNGDKCECENRSFVVECVVTRSTMNCFCDLNRIQAIGCIELNEHARAYMLEHSDSDVVLGHIAKNMFKEFLLPLVNPVYINSLDSMLADPSFDDSRLKIENLYS